MKRSHLIVASFVLLLLAAGCHSSRTTGRGERASQAERREASPEAAAAIEKPSKKGEKIVEEARRWLGVKYVYGGESRKGTDCSGMVMRVYESAAGIKLPRDSRSQRAHCTYIKRHELRPGDLVFFASKAGGGRVSHVGIYTGGGHFVHASASRGVIESNLGERYYARHFHSAGRVPGAATATKPEKKTKKKSSGRSDGSDTSDKSALSDKSDKTASVLPPRPTPADSLSADSIRRQVRSAMF